MPRLLTRIQKRKQTVSAKRRARNQHDEIRLWRTYSTYTTILQRKKSNQTHSNNIHQLYNYVDTVGAASPKTENVSAPITRPTMITIIKL